MKAKDWIKKLQALPEEAKEAFDELYMGVKHFRNGIGFVVMPEG